MKKTKIIGILNVTPDSFSDKIMVPDKPRQNLVPARPNFVPPVPNQIP